MKMLLSDLKILNLLYNDITSQWVNSAFLFLPRLKELPLLNMSFNTCVMSWINFESTVTIFLKPQIYISSIVNLYLNVLPLVENCWLGSSDVETHFPFWLSGSPLSDCSVKSVPMMSRIDWLLLIILWLFTNQAVRQLKPEFIINGPNKKHRNAVDKKYSYAYQIKTHNVSLKHFPAALCAVHAPPCNSTESCGMQCTVLQTDR